MFNKTFVPTFERVFGSPFSSPIYSGVLIPPSIDELLVWLRGISTNSTKIDSHRQPDAENFTMSQSHCISLNGTDEYGTLDTAITFNGAYEITFDIFLETSNITGKILDGPTDNRFDLNLQNSIVDSRSYITQVYVDGVPTYTIPQGFHSIRVVGTATTEAFFVIGKHAYVSSFLLGAKLYNLRLKDFTQDIHFRMAEGSGMYSWDDTGDRYITWSGAEVDLWGQLQDSYHANVTLGWWEIDSDPVKYPYPVTGFDTYHRGGTFNGAETSFAPEEKPVGTFVAGDSIATPTNHGSLSSYAGTAGLVYNGATIQRITDGWARNLVFSDGTIIPLDEGEGTDIHDSEGNLVGTLSGALPDFWIAGEPMVAQSIIDMEAVQSTKYFTDGEGHALPTTQADWEALGSELVENGEFFTDTNWTKGTGWTIAGGVAVATAVSNTDLYQNVGFESGKTYQITFEVVSISAGTIKFANPAVRIDRDSIGVYTETWTASSDPTVYFKGDSGFTGSVDNISVREVNPIITQAQPDIVVNGDFEDWTDPTVPDGFTKTGTHDGVNNFVEEVPDGCRFVSDGTLTGLITPANVVSGNTYKLKAVCTAASGTIKVQYASGTVIQFIDTAMDYEIEFIASETSAIYVYRHTAHDITLSLLSVKEIKGNNQYFWKNTEPKQLSLYKNVLTGQDLIDAKEYNGVA